MKVLTLVTLPRPFFNQQINCLRNAGIDIDIIEVPGRESASGDDKRSLRNYMRFYLNILKTSITDYDLVHANYGLTAPFALAQPNRPVVVSFWGSDLMGENDQIIKLCSTAGKYADQVILPSPIMASEIDYEYKHVPFGVNPELFTPLQTKKARELVGWSTDENIVLFPYQKTRPVKNYPLAEKIVKQMNNVQLRNLSNVPYEEVPIYMNASDCILLTSKRESGPMVVKEAALCNVPVVSTDVGFVSDVLSDVKNSHVCNSEKELVNRLEDVLESSKRSDGRKHADEWGLDKMGERLLEVYESVLEDR